ncbi:hypothetical protein [Pseudomonas phage vB_PaeM_PS3]
MNCLGHAIGGDERFLCERCVSIAPADLACCVEGLLVCFDCYFEMFCEEEGEDHE